ncbi:MAG: hypothetical protein M0Q91_10070 [Methanoregula sp.]|jgi:hypothetical protein|nr:hypothetical protein [Methanoregula sp.]
MTDSEGTPPRDVFAEESTAKKLSLRKKVSNAVTRIKASKYCPFGK